MAEREGEIVASIRRNALWSSGLIALLVAGSAIPAEGTPLWAIGSSTDAWEHSGSPLEQCVSVPDELVFMPEIGVAMSATGRLDGTSFIALTDQEASTFLDLRRDDASASLAEQVLTYAIAVLTARRSRAYEQRQGSWSMADEQNLVALTRRRDALDERPLFFYLVRALASDPASLQDVAASICDQTLLTSLHSSTIPGPADAPERLAMVVLLETPPERSVARWTYPYREPERD